MLRCWARLSPSWSGAASHASLLSASLRPLPAVALQQSLPVTGTPGRSVASEAAVAMPPPGSRRLTPMLRQYAELKQQHPGYVLMFRMGDFYEMFYEDAVRVAAACDITLTKRGKSGGQAIPMCGVPHHALDTYLERLVRKGMLVAVCEQVEAPAASRKAGRKLVRREVRRLVTPGTLVEDRFLHPRCANYLAAVASSRSADDVAVSWLDLSTGEFGVSRSSIADVAADLARLAPSEVVISPATSQVLGSATGEYHVTERDDTWFDPAAGRSRLSTVYQGDAAAMAQITALDESQVAACGSLLMYVEETQKTSEMPHLSPLACVSRDSIMGIDPATRRSLELVETMHGEREGSVLDVLDATLTASGGRLLANRLSAPLTDIDEIRQRHDLVEVFVRAQRARKSWLEDIRTVLRSCYDMERSLQRLSLGKGGPRDLANVAASLANAAAVSAVLCEHARDRYALPPTAAALAAALAHDHSALVSQLSRALVDTPPTSAADGGFVARGYSPELDEVLRLRDDSESLIREMAMRYKDETGVASLKIAHNRILGYYIEVHKRHRHVMPEDTFHHSQTMVDVMRYRTRDLSDLELRVQSAAAQAQQLERSVFADLVAVCVAHAGTVAATASALAQLDVAIGLADVSVRRGYIRPELCDESVLEVEQGRHVVLEALMTTRAVRDGRTSSFVPNSCALTRDTPIWLLTGPNMGGKSTFLRQTALLAILAQAGSFVPAARARIGVVDRVFSRVGASDDLSNDQSTFMKEMVEATAILRGATSRSLVIMDELGRGTATYDGLALAWAVLEHLCQVIQCRSLFATHYQQLAHMPQGNHVGRMAAWQLDVAEDDDGIAFLHSVVPGVAKQSYGIHVARLAGMPAPVVQRAQAILAVLEQDSPTARLGQGHDGVRDVGGSSGRTARLDRVLKLLEETSLDQVSPRQALQLLWTIDDILAEGEGER